MRITAGILIASICAAQVARAEPSPQPLTATQATQATQPPLSPAEKRHLVESAHWLNRSALIVACLATAQIIIGAVVMWKASQAGPDSDGTFMGATVGMPMVGIGIVQLLAVAVPMSAVADSRLRAARRPSPSVSLAPIIGPREGGAQLQLSMRF